ncbi:hypothetical protein BDV96DRAFT_574106 [Lophiotrema nucula]|uniref:VCBS repeat-containing protein n=1 Tax=Lophiotrema nucula TaxID=690887 RepID=A0A6A5ZA85_9PLEO|nr:hypothetical protein BDV96DRAFT_574106 [Lophiotrema nucula]
MYRNAGNGPDQGANAAKTIWYTMGEIASGVGGLGRQVRLADLDGDGRADYITVKDDGSATVWWNLGFDANRDPKVVWHSATGEKIASGIGDGLGVRFADMNGDGKAEFIHMDTNAAVTLYLNQGRKTDGTWT